MNTEIGGGSPQFYMHPKENALQIAERLVWLTITCGLVIVVAWQMTGGGCTGSAREVRGDNVGGYLDLMTRVWSDIQAYSFDQDKSELKTLAEGALSGSLEALGDSYTRFLDSSHFEALDVQIKRRFPGIGAQISHIDNELVIRMVIPGSPAEDAKLQPYDVIARIDGSDTSVLTFQESLDLLTGEPGSKVSLEIKRDGSPEPLKIDLIRREIQLQSVQKQLVGDVGYLRLSLFGENSDEEVAATIRGLLDQGAKKFIVDLRGNPGGLLETALGMTNLFVCDGVLVETRDHTGKSEIDMADPAECILASEPLIVLVDGDSASASEILAGDVKDTNRGLIIGSTTYGKGSVQQVFKYASPEDKKKSIGMRLTIGLYYTSGGNSIHESGVTPHIVEASLAPTKAETPMVEYIARNHPAQQVLKKFRGDFEASLEFLRKEVEAAGFEFNRVLAGRMLWQQSIPGAETDLVAREFDPVVDRALSVFENGLYEQFIGGPPSYFDR